MAVELQRLMEKVSHMDVNLIAGKGGIHNLVTWVHMVETTEASDFSKVAKSLLLQDLVLETEPICWI